MARLPNYIEASNPFKLSGPPSWFLQQLWQFDSSLVIIPSKQGFYYRLTQRRRLQLPEKIVNEILREQADTQMLASYGLVPVTTILATANWGNPYIFVELQRRAPWRMGGADRYNQLIEEQEKREALNKNLKQDDMLNYLSKDAWRYYQKLIGTRSHLWSPVTKGSKSLSNSHNVVVPSSIKSYKPEVMTTWLSPNK